MNRSKNAQSSFDIRSRAKLVFIADTGLKHNQATMRNPFVDTFQTIMQVLQQYLLIAAV
ncbi:hypothetical protein JMK10_15275 [Rhodovulum sulfidophilum]|uniref:hypothetical protein n=1 Tax=Rhodovulum sulfidophilum TaxID=35806 RepID=UPI001920B93B|nr:hypothetical protein [Rhodovulum sulfidophilum]MBL3574912.1 hypothetical protein [Rhodovulum sulfidophilum]MCE8431059.1 hypothetical protein [Rhodovulum sulfidophilum]MCF4118142.1 hypothetical protein [Rhodovulum sulfidophilum]